MSKFVPGTLYQTTTASKICSDTGGMGRLQGNDIVGYLGGEKIAVNSKRHMVWVISAKGLGWVYSCTLEPL